MPQLQCEEIRFPSADGVHTVAASMYTMPGVPVRAVLQLSHGMCEYVQRYCPMAQWYAQRGIALAGNDHLGHGGTANKGEHGHYGEPRGRYHLLNDLHTMNGIIHQKFPGPLETLLDSMNAPVAFTGFLVALLILSPEGLGALKAVLNHILTRLSCQNRSQSVERFPEFPARCLRCPG